MFLRNYWYVAAWADEVTRQPLARTMLGEPVVLYRKQDGSPVALEDRCVHRRLPLSMGALIGDDIQCHYHSLLFDCTGACVKIPGQPRIPPSARVKSYPVVDRNRAIWVWMGDPAAADESLIYDFSPLMRPGWSTTKVHYHLEANYLLVVDNLLDLSHLSTVHASTVGSVELADDAEVETTRKGDQVRVARWTMNVKPARTYQQFGKYTTNVDRWQISDFAPPSFFTIDNGSAVAGSRAREGRGEGKWWFNVCHGITPATANTTNYFWAIAHPTWSDDPAEIEEFHRQCRHVIGEDVAVFVAQQKCIDLDPAAPTIDIKYDTGPLLARRIVDELLRKEAAATPAARRPRAARPRKAAAR